MSIRIKRRELTEYITRIFTAKGMKHEDACITAEVLVAADARGIPSHGVARLQRYLAGIDEGIMKLDAEPEILKESSNNLAIDAHCVMGQPVCKDVMERLIEKADTAGCAFASIRNSNHFGIAGYYAMLPLKKDMIGIAMTNTAALGVPTFGRQVMFGTNPIAVAVPAEKEIPFCLDMSTTVVTRGKIEVYNREEKKIPKGWAVNENGLTAENPGALLKSMLTQSGGGILPLGGEGEEFGGYKGYGLAVMVDIFCALLSGGTFGPDVFDSAETSALVSHFFGVLKIANFREPSLFKTDMDKMLRRLKNTVPAEGHSRVYYAGLKEAEYEKESEVKGVLLTDIVWERIKTCGQTLNISPPNILQF